MEIEGQDGTITHLKEGSQLVFGRGKGFDPNDLAVSRRHISFELTSNSQSAPRVSFEVIGKNPIWVCNKESGEIRAFKRFERGELGVGDLFCATSTDPVWFSLKKGHEIERERKLGEKLEVETSTALDESGQDLDLGFDSIDVSSIDPVKEFGFLVIGHEFDSYTKAKILDVRSWNWFLEDARKDSTEDEDESHRGKERKTLRRKRKKKADGEEDDEEWTGESEDEDVVMKAKKPHERKYSSRSKDPNSGRLKKDGGGRKGSTQKRSKYAVGEEDEEDDEDDDETLGGFIVDDVDEVEELDGDEEEEFEEGEDE